MNKFRNSNNRQYLKGLFYEEVNEDKSTVIYTLKDEDHKGFPSLYRLYMETGDPTEYEFAVTHLDGWSHWEALTACTWFKPYVERWRRELAIKLKSQALAKVREMAKEGKDVFAANKFLLDKGWEEKPGKGRPNKEQIKKAADEIAQHEKRVSQDFERILGGGIALTEQRRQH
jgi:hypothetical protein